MAHEVALRLFTTKSVKHIFWISASSPEVVEGEYEEIAQRILLPKREARCQETIRAVKRWLEEASNGTWLLICDNFSRSLFEEASPFGSTSFYLPNTLSHGRLIITTCVRGTALDLVSHRQDLYFEVPELEDSEAYDLLKASTPDEAWTNNQAEDEKNGTRLAKKLDKNPAAIAMVSAYIDKLNEDGETISTYWKTLQSMPLMQPIPKSYHGLGDIVLAWERTFAKVESESQETIELLAMMSCLNRTHIPKLLLCCYVTCDNMLREHLGTLSDYRIIVSDDLGKTYTMSSLVQMVAHGWLSKNGTRPVWQRTALDTLFKFYEKMRAETGSMNVNTYVRRRQLLPHADVLVQYCKISSNPKIRVAEAAEALFSFATLYICEHKYKAARVLLDCICEHYQQNDSWKLQALKEKAETIRINASNGKATAEARGKELERARNILKKAKIIALQLSDENTQMDLHSHLALNYRDAQRWKLAEKFQNEVVKYWEIRYPPEREELHSEVIQSRIRLSLIYYSHGCCRGPEREKNLTRARKEQEKLLDILLEETHLSKLIDHAQDSRICEIQAALARTLYKEHKFSEAITMARKAYEWRKKTFGMDDMKTLGTQQDLAFCFLQNGNAEAAEIIFKDAQRRLTDQLGRNHMDVWDCMEKWRNFLAIKEKLKVKDLGV